MTQAKGHLSPYSVNSSLTRRAVLGAAALAGGAALNLGAIVAAKAENPPAAEGFPDPIFDLIERHRETELRKLSAGAAYSEVLPRDPNHDEAITAVDTTRREVEVAGAALLDTMPTTRAGVFALVEYVLAFNAGAVRLPCNHGWVSGAFEWPEITDEYEIDVTGFAFLEHVAEALKEIERKAVAS
jgi:hypothetical protein